MSKRLFNRRGRVQRVENCHSVYQSFCHLEPFRGGSLSLIFDSEREVGGRAEEPRRRRSYVFRIFYVIFGFSLALFIAPSKHFRTVNFFLNSFKGPPVENENV